MLGVREAARMPKRASTEDELREPTREELYAGPGRDALPESVRGMSKDETACRCVSAAAPGVLRRV